MNCYPLVSVYTCVYNGAHTIHRVFDSMKKIGYPNLEHSIINDGSTDNLDELVEKYRNEVSFPVKYHKKENGGKHTALNIAWNIAEGEFLIQCDADDELLSHSIKFLVDTYYTIPEAIRDDYWCVHGRCITQHGDFVGNKYPDKINEQPWRQANACASKCTGEKIGLQVRKYLSNYRFPEIVGTHHLPEGIIWHQLNREYGTWYTNEVVRIYYVGEGGNLTAKRTKRSQFAPHAYYFKWQIMHEEWYGKSIKRLFKYALCYSMSWKKYRKHNKYLDEIHKHKLVLSIIYPASIIGSFLYRSLKRIK